MVHKDLHLSVTHFTASMDEDGTVNYSNEINRTVDQLKHTNIYTSDDAAEALRDYAGSEIAIVELPAAAVDAWGATPSEISNDLLARSDQYKLVITYISDEDSFGLEGENQELTIEAYQTVLSSDAETAEEAIFESYESLIGSVDVRSSRTTPGSQALASVGVGAFSGILIASVLIGTIGKRFVTKASNNSNQTKAKHSQAIPKPEFERKAIRSDKTDELGIFKDYALQHQKLGYAESSAGMHQIIMNLDHLYKRLHATGSLRQIELAKVEYDNILKRLNKALSDEYYGDIKKNARFWSKPEVRMNEVHDALRATNNLIVENIKSHNETRDLDFRVGLEGIMDKIELPKAASLLRSDGSKEAARY